MRALLVYPLSTDHAPNAGIIQKMRQQTAAFQELGLETAHVHSSQTGLYRDGSLYTPYWPQHLRLAPIHHRSSFYRASYEVAESWRPDLVYLRYPMSTPLTVSFMAAVKTKLPEAKLVVEVPTYPYEGEPESLAQRAGGMVDRLCRVTLKHWVDLIVTFYGQEEIFGIPCYPTTNGISPDKIRLRSSRVRDGRIRALAVANLAQWHGYDRFIEGMALDEAARVELTVVGDGPARPDLERLVRQRRLEDRVHFAGIRRGAELDALFDESDVAVASLGHHRIGLRTANSLKAREYCARGIPFVLATPDLDFPKGGVGWHEFPADDTPTSMDEVASLATRARETPATRTTLREYAEQRLSWRAKLEGLLARPELRGESRGP